MIINPETESLSSPARPIHLVRAKKLDETLATLPEVARTFIKDQNYTGEPGSLCLYPTEQGEIGGALFGETRHPIEGQDSFALAALQSELPAKPFRLIDDLERPELFALAWMLNRYQYSLPMKETGEEAALVLPHSVDKEEVSAIAEAMNFGRDLINQPANLLGPDELCQVVELLARENGGACSVIAGEPLAEEFPLIAAVGAGSARPPALIDLTWGDPKHRTLTLVGKGIVFDSGGLDIKPPRFMQLMKKDMGGAAAVLALAKLIMARRMPIRLRVLVPTAENAIGANAFRPGDVITSRQGLTVEVGDTDAEGRLVLADALSLAMESPADLTLDMATLTGAARVALGPAIAPFLTRNDHFADGLMQAARATDDPVWRLPLWQPYARGLSSKIADTNSITNDGFAGTITAALFLEKFVTPSANWAHFDIYGWNPTAQPGRPQGGEVHAVRALYHYLKRWALD